MFKHVRQQRYDRLIKEGFLPFEAFALSKFKFAVINDIRNDRRATVRNIAKYRGGKVYKQDIRNHVITTYKNRYGRLDPIEELFDRHGGISGFAKYLTDKKGWNRNIRDLIEDASPNKGRPKDHHGKGSQRKYKSRVDKGNVKEQRKRRKERERERKTGKPNG